MNQRFCSFIVLGPAAPHTLKLHLSRGAVAILALSFLISFFVVVWAGYTFPPTINDVHRTKLEAENRTLKLETSNAEVGIQKLNAKVAELEALSKRIEDLVVPAS